MGWSDWSRPVQVLVAVGAALLALAVGLVGWVWTLSGLAAIFFAIALTPVLYALLAIAAVVFAIAWWLRRRSSAAP